MQFDTPEHISSLDRWNAGTLDGLHKQTPTSADADYMAGYRYGQDCIKVRPVMPDRPEGYYHLPTGTFD